MKEAERHARQRYDKVARWYDWRNRLAGWLRGVSSNNERRRVIDRLGLQPGQRLLEVACGTGTNFPLIAERYGKTVRITGLDISRGMLAICHEKIVRDDLPGDVVEGSATVLPFADASFDAVLNHGGLAEFPDKRAAIAEMARVVRPGCRVTICDVGVHESGKTSFINNLLLTGQPEYRVPPPMDLLPPDAKDTHLSWFSRDSWYLLEFTRA